jgi:GNAT superfamily N-acetyltransferase
LPASFRGGPNVTEVFCDVYEALDPGCCVVAENTRSGRLMGSCFYHPRPHHVSLGIMNAHPNYFGRGVGSALLRHIVDFAKRQQKPVRLTSSALNLDSFSLYNKAGFTPRFVYQDMYIQVPESGLDRPPPGADRVRPATLHDVPAMARLEMEVSRITREQDYRYCINNQDGFWNVSVCDSAAGDLDGFIVSSGHSGVNILGPCVARGQEQAAALVFRELDHHRGRSPLLLPPVECQRLVRQLYDWGARNCELHFCQVLGEFHPFQGVNMPSFLPETG